MYAPGHRQSGCQGVKAGGGGKRQQRGVHLAAGSLKRREGAGGGGEVAVDAYAAIRSLAALGSVQQQRPLTLAVGQAEGVAAKGVRNGLAAHRLAGAVVERRAQADAAD